MKEDEQEKGENQGLNKQKETGIGSVRRKGIQNWLLRQIFLRSGSLTK